MTTPSLPHDPPPHFEHFDFTMKQPIGPDIMDFSIARPPIKFKIDGDVFDAYPEVPALILMEFSAKSAAAVDRADDQAAMDEMVDSLKLVLKPESAALFIDRMRNYENAIGIEHVKKVIPWVLEQYGLRPTEPASDSSDTPPSQGNGTTSTASTEVVALPSGSFP